MIEVRVGSWKFRFEQVVLQMTLKELSELSQIIQEWEKVFIREKNGVESLFRKPTLLVRVDYVLQPEGVLGVYEVEERPCGIGMGVLCHSYFREKFAKLFAQWKKVCGKVELIVSPHRIDSSDDREWAQVLGVPMRHTPEMNGAFCWVRADPPEKEFHPLTPRSLTSIVSEGDKRYGLALGLWNEIPLDTEQLPWQKGFALKPLQGSRMQNLHLWKPRARKDGGLATRTKLLQVISEGRVAFYQNWIEPERPQFLQDGSMLLRRVFFGWNVEQAQWECAGGFYTVRERQYRIHGASDAVFGLMFPPA